MGAPFLVPECVPTSFLQNEVERTPQRLNTAVCVAKSAFFPAAFSFFLNVFGILPQSPDFQSTK